MIPDNMAQLATQLSLHDNILPERLMVIGSWDKPNVASGLYALDKRARLIVILLANQSPLPRWIKEAAEFAWSLRHTGYTALNQLSKKHFESNGIDAGDLAELHSNYFYLNKPVPRTRFNRDQRLLILAPDFSRKAIKTINRRGFELNIQAYQVAFLDPDVDGNFFKILKLPSSLAGRLLDRLINRTQ